MLFRRILHGQCQFLMRRAFTSVQRTVVSFSTNAKGTGTSTGEPHSKPVSSAAQQTVRSSPPAGNHSHDQISPNFLPSIESGVILCDNHSTSRPNHSSLQINTENGQIGEASRDAAPKPWKRVLVRSERRKQDKRIWNKLLKDKGLLSYNWRIPLEALEEHYDQSGEAGKASKPEWEAFEPEWEAPESEWEVSKSEWEASRAKMPLIRQKHAEQIEPQPIWTASTFMKYVRDLTTSLVDRSAKYHLYGKEGSHPMTVSNVLERLFSEVATKNLLSAKACNTAMLYFFKHNQISKAKAIFNKMEHFHQEIQTPTVNILLLAAANQRDLHNFTFMLKRMLRWGFEPDEGTWNALLITVESNDVRGVIVKSMQRRNLLKTPSIVRNVVSTIIRDELIKHLDSGFGLDSFLSFLDLQYGINWLSVDAANNFLDEVGKRKGLQEAVGLLDILRTRGLKADGVTLGTLLQTCRFYNERFMVIRLLQLFESEYSVVPGQDSYNILFGMAWNNRMYNFLKVMWTSACVEGLTSKYMCQLVSHSLRSEEENPPDGKRKNNNKIWKNSAGAVAVGIMSRNASDQNSLSTNVAMADVQQNEDEDARTKERLLKMMDEDLTAMGRYQLEKSLIELLISAQALDGEWHRSGAWKAKSTEWKRENAIVPILMQPQSRPAMWRHVHMEKRIEAQ